MPKDFTKKSFSRTIRGYSPDDVDRYLKTINGEYGKLERHSAENERRLLFALRKLESLTKELQSIYSSEEESSKEPEAEVRQISVNGDEIALEEKKAELRVLDDELSRAKAELEAVRIETEKLRSAAEERARALLSAARSRGDSIILEAQTKSDAIVAESAKKARAAAEQIITDAALASRKIIRDAETRADEASRDLMTIYGAAEKMYREVSDFRGDMFSLYSNHISSIETITDSANGMIDSVNGIIRGLDGGDDISLPEEASETDSLTEAPEEMPNDSDSMATLSEETAEEQTAEYDPDQASIFDLVDAVEEKAPTDLYIDIEDESAAPESETTDENDAEGADDEPEESLPADNSDASRDEEYYDSFDMIPEDEEDDGSLPWDDEEKPESVETVEEIEKTEETEEDTGDDFDFNEDSSSATNVLDIVKKLGGAPKPQKTVDDDFFEMAALMQDEGVTAEEFRKVFDDTKVSSDVDEIMKQPLASPSAPANPKKHSRF